MLQGATQTEVYDATTRPIVDAALTGYNGTVFAYGQTSTGKKISFVLQTVHNGCVCTRKSITELLLFCFSLLSFSLLTF